MPQTKSAKKALRQSRRRKAVNELVRQRMKKAVRSAQKNPDLKTLSEASRVLDRAATKGIIHKRKAAKVKSRLGRSLKRT